MMRWKLLRLLMLVCLCAVVTAARAQDGQGVVTLIDVGSDFAAGSDFQLFDDCDTAACLRQYRLTYPTLFAVDPALNVIRHAEAGESVVVANPPAMPAQEQQYTVQAGLTWHDGSPVTAYDVAFSLIGRELRASLPFRVMDGFRVDDESTFTVRYVNGDCTSQARLNAGILPSEMAMPGFRAFAENLMAEESEMVSVLAWRREFRDAFFNATWSPRTLDLITGGAFAESAQDPETLVSTDGDLVVQSLNLPFQYRTLTFANGDANLLIDPPVEARADLRLIGDAVRYEAPGYAVDRLVFNLSDSNYPRSAFSDGEPVEQLPNLILSDVRVRRAVRLAIDVPALIDGALQGNGVPLNGVYSPASWAYDSTLPEWEYDPIEAQALLDQAGWVGREGVRRCLGCAFPELSSRLSLVLEVDSDPVRSRVASLIAIQLERVGFEIRLNQTDSYGGEQNFDLLLTGVKGATLWEREPDLTYHLSQNMDVRGIESPISNPGSYFNPDMESLLEAGRTVSTCAVADRAAIYSDVQRRINEELPFTSLYARNDFYMARGIGGYAPLPGEPLRNITDWVVTR